MTFKMEKLQKQRDKVQCELDKVTAELDAANTQRSVAEAKKSETENSLKTEIKTLITKLMQTKEKIAINISSPVSKPQRSISTYGSAKQVEIKGYKPPRVISSKTPSKNISSHDDTNYDMTNNNTSEDLDEYEAKQFDEGSCLALSARKMPDFQRKCLHDLNG